MKTAVQIMYDRYWQVISDSDKLKLLELEKQQIIDAHEAGQLLIVDSVIKELSDRNIKFSVTKLEIDKIHNGEIDEEALDYFNQTFKD